MMFEKVVMKVLLGSACAGVVTCVGYMVYSLVSMIQSDRKIDKTMDELQERNRRRWAMMEEALMQKIQEAK